MICNAAIWVMLLIVQYAVFLGGMYAFYSVRLLRRYRRLSHRPADLQKWLASLRASRVVFYEVYGIALVLVMLLMTIREAVVAIALDETSAWGWRWVIAIAAWVAGIFVVHEIAVHFSLKLIHRHHTRIVAVREKHFEKQS